MRFNFIRPAREQKMILVLKLEYWDQDGRFSRVSIPELSRFQFAQAAADKIFHFLLS